MGIFDRLSTMLRSNINDLISRAENPEKMLNQLIVDMKTRPSSRSPPQLPTSGSFNQTPRR
jgi:PspA/IM30 family